VRQHDQRPGVEVELTPMLVQFLCEFSGFRSEGPTSAPKARLAPADAACRPATAAHPALLLQLHALADNLANFTRTLALPRAIAHRSLTTLREKLVKIGARMVRHGRYITFQMAEVAVSGRMFGQILARIARLRAPPVPA